MEKYLFYTALLKLVISPLLTFLLGWVIPSPLSKKKDPKEEIVLPQKAREEGDA